MKPRRSPRDDSRAKVESLRRMPRGGGEVGPVEVIETHFSWVFLTAQHAYKLKKPVRQDAMDYRTLGGRRRGCQTEVRLNRRLAPAVYLGMVPLRRAPGGELHLSSTGRVVDWLVDMRRLPAERMLDVVMGRGQVTASELHALVQLLARFYGSARRRPLAARRYLQQLSARTADNARELLRPQFRLEQRAIHSLVAAQQAFIRLHASQLGARGARVVDAHGDLRPEHICLGAASEQPAIIDCLEFDAALRRLDPLEDLAFLILECLHQDAPAVARALLNGVRHALDDAASVSLVHFYMSQRAAIRAKLAARHLRDPQFRPHFDHWHRRAQRYLHSALLFARMAARGVPRAQSSIRIGDGPVLEQGR